MQAHNLIFVEKKDLFVMQSDKVAWNDKWQFNNNWAFTFDAQFMYNS